MLDQDAITTSEGQGYGMLRAVWSNDRATFDAVWRWTRENLQMRGDNLFAWKWKKRVLDRNSAADADNDIALALLLAARRFGDGGYREAALAVLGDIWAKEVVTVGERSYLVAGDWAAQEATPTIHVAYLAPYAFGEFAAADGRHPWERLVTTSYALLHWLYDTEGVRLPPEIVSLDRKSGEFLRPRPSPRDGAFSYDAFPIFWRVAVDADWFHRDEGPLRRKMLSFFEEEWRRRGKFLDRYTTDGEPRSAFEGLPLYATVQALAALEGNALAEELTPKKLDALWDKALLGQDSPYYLHNWLWFGSALELGVARPFDEILAFLRPFDVKGFSSHFPWLAVALLAALFVLGKWHPLPKAAFLVLAVALCLRYLVWRLFHSLNFLETAGPFVSLSLWLAELYSFSTVALLWLQVSLRPRPRLPAVAPAGFAPTVDVLIPIYSESCEILEATLVGATAMEYEAKRIYVCDDSHRDEVRAIAERFGATYFAGPRRHAKAGNLNAALERIEGDLVVVFDTDHIPVRTFLEETVPLFADPKLGVVQTPHCFYNEDIFQRALWPGGRVPNEQDMFNHAIQSGRDSWGGAFFVGSGAVFRRAALRSVGNFQLLSITEDIHTSQHLHAAGWSSAFVDKNLAVGLSAENLSSYIVQRRRWMLGCLQIFFKDNPLLLRNLPWRHRLGYFASLYYFFFPLARVVFWMTPLCYLLFHWHPILSDVSILMAYLVPFLVALPLMTRALLPGWPRAPWGSLYEAVVTFPLFRSLFDLFLPKRLGFKVTPKGIVSERRRYDFVSTRATLVAAAVTLLAMGKGLTEALYFGIEKDAYFFNLIWAGVNLISLGVALLLGWERPQRREQERVRTALRFSLVGPGFRREAATADISLSGLAFEDRGPVPEGPLRVSLEGDIRLPAALVRHDGRRCALRFTAVDGEARRALVAAIFTRPETWKGFHERRTRHAPVLIFCFLAGMVRNVRSLRARRRMTPRRRALVPLRLVESGRGRTALLVNRSAGGLALCGTGRAPAEDEPWLVLGVAGTKRWARPVYRRRVGGVVWRMGLEFHPEPLREPPVTTILAY